MYPKEHYLRIEIRRQLNLYLLVVNSDTKFYSIPEVRFKTLSQKPTNSSWEVSSLGLP